MPVVAANSSLMADTPTTLIHARLIAAALKRAGIDLAASLPDSWLSPLINELEADPEFRHVRVTREDDGVGICAGAYLGGRKAALVCQNGGLLLSINALMAFGLHHQVPFLIVCAYRGSHDDSYYWQAFKGRVTEPVLQATGLPFHMVRSAEEFHLIEETAREAYLIRRPGVVLMSRRALLGPVGPDRGDDRVAG